MGKKSIVFETSDLRKLRELIEDYVEYNGGMTEFEDILEDFDCKYVLNDNFENFKGQVKDLVNDVNDSDRMEEFIDYMAKRSSTASRHYYQLLEPYLEEPGIKLEIKTVMKSLIEDGKPIDYKFLSDSTLDSVKTFIFNSGKTFEKLPETFSNFSEPVLRDVILAMLNSVFEGSATGETFSGSGKNDIHIQFSGYDSLSIECKYWDGVETLDSALNQLFSFNTPNEGFGIIVMFSTRSDFDDILEKTKVFLKNHPTNTSKSLDLSHHYLISKHHHPQIEGHKFTVHTIIFNLHHVNTQKK